MSELLRLDRYLSEVSKRTRKEAKTLICEGKVTVNQKVIYIPEQKINLETDQIALNGHLLCYCKMEYYLLNKPAGIVSASRDKREKTVVDLIQDRKREDLFPVGRLDKDTEGLLLITNDGALAHQLLSPKKHIDKVYFAKIKGKVDTTDQKKFQEGLTVDEEFTAMPAKLDILRVWQEDNDFYSEIHLTIREGKFHQVKRMFLAVGKEVLYLKRIAMGSICLPETLKLGSYRALTEQEIEQLKEEVSKKGKE